MDRTHATESSASFRSMVSLCLLIHLFFVAVCLSGNYVASPLTARLLDRFAFYTQLFNLDTDFKPYHLTHAMESDVDHFIEVDLQNGEQLRFPSSGGEGRLHYYRQQRLARAMAYLTANEAMVGELAGAVSAHAMHSSGSPAKQLRVRRHMLQDWEALVGGTAEERDPNSEVYYRTPYAANIVITGVANVRVVRIEDTGQVAQPADSGEGSEQ